MKLGLTYNYSYGKWKNNKWVIDAPKTKKVTWDIVGLDSYGAPMLNADDTPVENAYIKQYVTIKNGTITVKGFAKDERHEKNNHFAVRVKAADFDGNTTQDWIDDIYVSNDQMDIAKVALVQKDGTKYKVVALQDGKTVQPVKAKDVDGAFVLAVNKDSDAAVGKTYTYHQLWNRMGLQDPHNTTVKSSNKIAGIDYTERGVPGDANARWPYLDLTGTNKKISLTVTANDGSKSKNTLPLSLEYTELEGKDLSINVGTSDGAKDIYEAKKVEKDGAKAEFNVNGAARIYVTLQVGDKDKETSTDFDNADGFTNYKLAVKGGKKLTDAYGRAQIITTSAVTTITLTNPNVNKGEKAKVYTYTLTNKAYASTMLKAPKITVKGQLYEEANSDEQVVTMTAMDGKNPVGDFYARVEADWSALKNKNTDWNITNFNNQINSGVDGGAHIFKINKDTGTIDLKFNDGSDWTDFVPGSYKVKVTVGTGSTESGFTAKYLPANATIKVAKNKAFTFKPTTSYTINVVDGGAVLGGKSNVKAGEIGMDFNDLQNENKKGVVNKFTHYFKVEQVAGTNTQRLVLNEDDYLVQSMLFEPKMNGQEVAKDPEGNVIYDTTKRKEYPVINIPKEDLTGYIGYHVWAKKGYFTNDDDIYGYAKITVKIAAVPQAGKAAKATQKYVPDAAEIKLAKDTSKTEVNLKVNGSYVSVAYVMIDESKEKTNAPELALDGTGVNDDGQITFKAASALTEGQKYSTNLLVVPAGSYYADLIERAPAQAPAQAAVNAEGDTGSDTTTTPVRTKSDLIKLYGIPVKVTITAKANARTTDKMVEEENGGGDDGGDDTTSTLTSVTISAAGDAESIAKGGSLALTAAAKDSNDAAVEGVTWTWEIVEADKNAGITITGNTASATLTVAAAETKTSLTVKATATKGDDTVSQTKTINVKSVGSIELAAADNATSVAKGGSLVFTATLKNGVGTEISDLSGITVNWDLTGNTNSSDTKLENGSDQKTKTLRVAADEEGTEDTEDGNKKKLTVEVTADGVTQSLSVEVTG